MKFFLQLASDLFLLGMIMYEIILDKEFQHYTSLGLWHYIIYVHALGKQDYFQSFYQILAKLFGFGGVFLSNEYGPYRIP